MNGIDDLRDTLERHAGEVPVVDPSIRRTAVARRIGAARRRRRAGAAAASVGVAAVVAAAVLIPGSGTEAGPGPAGPVEAGVDVPATITALGHDFALTEHESGRDGRVTVTLPASDRLRLVSWATSGSDDEVTVTGLGNPTVHRSGDFDDWVVLEVDRGEDVTVAATDGSTPAVAVYELADTSAATLDEFVPGPVGDTNPSSLLAEEYQKDGHLWRQVQTTGRSGRDDRFSVAIPVDYDNVLVLTSLTGPGRGGATLQSDFGRGDGGRLEISAGSASGGGGGFVRQPGDLLRFETIGTATVNIGFYVQVD